MNDPFLKAKEKVQLAAEKNLELGAKVETFRNNNKPCVYVDVDPITAQRTHSVRFPRALPRRATHEVESIVLDLRATLDLFGAIAAELKHGKRMRHTAFPFSDSEATFANQAKGRCKDLPVELVQLFHALKPYQGGDDLLWSLNEAANAIKHGKGLEVRWIASAMCALSAGDARRVVNWGDCLWNWDKDEITLVTTAPGYTPELRLHIRPDVVFENVGTLAHKSVGDVLCAWVEQVQAIVEAMERVCAGIGLTHLQGASTVSGGDQPDTPPSPGQPPSGG